MHLSRLTIGEMLSLSQTFLDPSHPAHQALAGAPEVTSLMPRLREVNQVLLASQSADELRAGSLQKAVTTLDAEHDDLVSGLDCLFQSARLLIEDEEERARWEQLHELLLPEGRKLANMSYQVEADNAALLEHILAELPDADRDTLKKQYMGKRSALEIIERWIAVGKELGKKERERLSVPVAPTDSALQSAQHQWVRIVGAMSAMLQMAELLGELPPGVKQHVLGPLRAATDRKAQRRTGPDPQESPVQAPAASPSPQS
jgi:hypothetical protein